MRGSVYKRCQCPKRLPDGSRAKPCQKAHGSWSYKIDDLPGAAAGDRRQLVKGGYGTRREALAELHLALVARGQGTRLTASPTPLGTYLQQWLTGMRTQLSTTAWSHYAAVIRLYVPPQLAAIPLSALNGPTLTAHYAVLHERGGRYGRPLAPATVRVLHRVLHKACADAVDAELLVSNPVSRAKPPRRNRPETQVWSAEQARSFLAARARAEDRLLISWLLALTLGLRRGELAGLQWRDVDLDAATLRIDRQRTTDSGSNVVVKEPKGTSRRTLDLGPQIVAALRSHRLLQSRERLALGLGALDRDTALVTDELGGPLHPQRLTHLFRVASAEADMPHIRLHDARHTCATLALDAGLHPKVVQQLLGHSSWTVTMDLYSHRVARLQREATQRLEELVLVDPAQARPSG